MADPDLLGSGERIVIAADKYAISYSLNARNALKEEVRGLLEDRDRLRAENDALRSAAEALAEAPARVEGYFIGGWPDDEDLKRVDLKRVWLLVEEARANYRAIYPKAEGASPPASSPQTQRAVEALETLTDACGHWMAAGVPPHPVAVQAARDALNRGPKAEEESHGQ